MKENKTYKYKGRYKNYQRNWYLKNRERIKDKFKYRYYITGELKLYKTLKVKEFVSRWKGEIFKIVGKKCNKCGFEDERALQIDHVRGDGFKDNRVRNRSFYKKVAESLKRGHKNYQILCANCNWIKRWENNEHCKIRKSVNNVDSICKQDQKISPITAV